MNTITQTNRTILFEEINPEKLNLLTLVGDVRGVNSVSDDKIKEINDALLVRSFDEFLEKFEPVVYSYFDANNQKVIYTLKKPENIEDELLSEIHLNRQNDYLKMLMTLVEAKRAEGSINVDFKFEKLTDMISPKKVMDDIRQNRKELQYTYSEYAKLEDGDPKKLDTADKLNLMFEEASVNYNNVMAMLPLAIEDIKTRLLLGDGQTKKDEAPLSLGVLSMDEHGELKILEAPKENKKELMVQFCTAYKSILSKHSLSATAATGRLVSEATGLPVTLFLSKSQGGHQQIDARIAYNEIDLVFMFSDPNDTDPWEDQRIMRTLRLCDTYNVPCATNLASAEMLILGLQRGDLDWRMMMKNKKSIR